MRAMAGLSLERAMFPLIVLIVLIKRRRPIGVVELAGRVGRDHTTVNHQTARLEQLGLIEHRGSAADRVDAARETMALALFRDWETTDCDALVRLLGKLAHAMDAPRR